MREPSVTDETEHVLAVASVLLEVAQLLRGPLPERTRTLLQEIEATLLAEAT